MDTNELYGAIECLLFVSGDPVDIAEIQRTLSLTDMEMQAAIAAMDKQYREAERGIQLFITATSVQMVSNKKYAMLVKDMLQPLQSRSLSQAILETLSVIAYRQPVTRADIEAVRGVRCEYAVSQLLRMGMISEAGRRNCIGRPMQFATTDKFLRHFGITALDELPKYTDYTADAESEKMK